jgi:hypothetical protein
LAHKAHQVSAERLVNQDLAAIAVYLDGLAFLDTPALEYQAGLAYQATAVTLGQVAFLVSLAGRENQARVVTLVFLVGQACQVIPARAFRATPVSLAFLDSKAHPLT